MTFRHTDGSSGQYYIIESVTAGLATFDYDRDGLIDIYFLNGAPLQGAPRPEVPADQRAVSKRRSLAVRGHLSARPASPISAMDWG